MDNRRESYSIATKKNAIIDTANANKETKNIYIISKRINEEEASKAQTSEDANTNISNIGGLKDDKNTKQYIECTKRRFYIILTSIITVGLLIIAGAVATVTILLIKNQTSSENLYNNISTTTSLNIINTDYKVNFSYFQNFSGIS